MTSFSLNTASLELQSGENATVRATNVLPASTSTKDWLYESRDPAVASINSTGRITALAVGKTEIIVTADDIYGRSRSCTVVVKALPTSVVTTVPVTESTTEVTTAVSASGGETSVTPAENTTGVTSTEPTSAAD